MNESVLLPQSFYARDALEVAPDLLGRWIACGEVTLRITEVEAYRHPDDTASHCRMGRTTRNAPMWGPPGHAYVYLCYGMHNMLNLVTGAEGEGAAVLIRSCEPVAGESVVMARRGGMAGPASLAGPGKVGAALALSTAWSGCCLFQAGKLAVCEGTPARRILAAPRVGIDYAQPRDRKARWRFADADSPWVSVRGSLKPWRPRRPKRS
jgi:DNA-3-methyladenine glycosylase